MVKLDFTIDCQSHLTTIQTPDKLPTHQKNSSILIVEDKLDEFDTEDEVIFVVQNDLCDLPLNHYRSRKWIFN